MHLVLSSAIEGSDRGRHRRRAKPQREIRSPWGSGKRWGFAPKGPRPFVCDSLAQTEAAEAHVSVKDERIFQARRAGCPHALMGGGVSPEQAERWCDAWELEAARQGIGRSSEFWQDGRRWIDVQRAARKILPS